MALKKFREQFIISALFAVVVGGSIGLISLIDFRYSASSVALALLQSTKVSAPPLAHALFEGVEIRKTLLGLIEGVSLEGSILLTCFTFTDGVLADALIEQHKKGVLVEVITDAQSALRDGSKIPLLVRSGIPVYIYPSNDDLSMISQEPLGLMHNKYMIVRGFLNHKLIVVTGSYNWTKSAATRNKENIVVLESDDFAYLYIQAFNTLKQQSKRLLRHNNKRYERVQKGVDRIIQERFLQHNP